MDGRPTRRLFWVTAQVSFEVVKGFKIYLEARTWQMQSPAAPQSRSDAVWSAGIPAAAAAWDRAYTAYGRSYMAGLTYRF